MIFQYGIIKVLSIIITVSCLLWSDDSLPHVSGTQVKVASVQIKLHLGCQMETERTNEKDF